MPTVVKARIDAKPAATARAEILGAIVVLLGIVVVAALLASILPLPPVVEPTTDMFFAP
jgi:hypothetical protein